MNFFFLIKRSSLPSTSLFAIQFGVPTELYPQTRSERRFKTRRCQNEEFDTGIYDASEIMKAHCRIKKSSEVTARAGATRFARAGLPGVARISPLHRAPSWS